MSHGFFRPVTPTAASTELQATSLTQKCQKAKGFYPLVSGDPSGPGSITGPYEPAAERQSLQPGSRLRSEVKTYCFVRELGGVVCQEPEVATHHNAPVTLGFASSYGNPEQIGDTPPQGELSLFKVCRELEFATHPKCSCDPLVSVQ